MTFGRTIIKTTIESRYFKKKTSAVIFKNKTIYFFNLENELRNRSMDKHSDKNFYLLFRLHKAVYSNITQIFILGDRHPAFVTLCGSEHICIIM